MTKSSLPSARAATAIDQIIAARIKGRRIELGMSQQALASRLGVTFQQVQKYERGANRVAASRLFEISLVLEKPLTWFFEPVRKQSKGKLK